MAKESLADKIERKQIRVHTLETIAKAAIRRAARSYQRTGRKPRHSFIEPHDEANLVNGVGYWVPSPEQIEAECVAIRYDRVAGMPDPHTLREPSSREPVKAPEFKKELEPSAQLCDCPYWGTEFAQ